MWSIGLYLKLTAAALPLSFPFWHFEYPNCHEFRQLSGSEDSYIVAKTERVNFLYSDSGCYHGFKMIDGTSFFLGTNANIGEARLQTAMG
jgi:hypothetical protein